MRSPEGAGAAAAGAVVAPSPDTARRFVEGALEAFEEASRRTDPIVERIAVGGHPAELAFAGRAMHARLFPALAHLRSREAGAPPLRVGVFDGRSSGVALQAPAWAPGGVGARGEVAGGDGERARVAFNVGSGILVAYDADLRRAVVWARDADDIPYYETASPMRPLLAWWLGDAGVQVVHAAAVGRAGRAALLTGRGGSGKTTTALACVAAGWGYGGDNNVAIEAKRPPRGYALYASATVRPGTLERLPALRARLANAARLDVEKGLLFVDAWPGTRLLPSFSVDAVLLPRVGEGADSRLEPASAAECMAALAPSSVMSLPGAGAASFARLAAIARAVPAYRLVLGSDLDALPHVVASVLGDGA